MNPIEVVQREILSQGFADVSRDLLKKPTGEELWYTWLSFSTDATAILAQDEEGLWILNREYRYPLRRTVLGCPGGRIDPGEKPEAGARRELLEETGYYAEELIFLGVAPPLPGLSSQLIYYFYAPRAWKQREPKLDPFEWISFEKKTTEELIQETKEGASVDGVLLTALSYYTIYNRK